MSSRSLWSILLAGLVVLAAVPAVWLVARPDTRVGDVERFAAASDAASPAPTASAPAADAFPTTVSEAAPLIGGDLLKPGGDRWLLEPDRRPTPTEVRIPALGVETVVTGLGVDAATGQMDVPRNGSDVAWYRHGPIPGEEGSAVLAAHVDYDGRPGVFFDLKDLEPGQAVEVELSDGSVHHFVVEARAVFSKEDLPLDRIFAREGAPVLTLVTCGGGFNATERSYDSNVVVFAVPVEEAPPEEAA